MPASPLIDLDQNRSRNVRVDCKLTETNLEDISRRSPAQLDPRTGENTHGDQLLRVPSTLLLMHHPDNARRLPRREISQRQRPDPLEALLTPNPLPPTPHSPYPTQQP
jgi:hypothetical protein